MEEESLQITGQDAVHLQNLVNKYLSKKRNEEHDDRRNSDPDIDSPGSL
jgi:hypothetical protein